MENIEEINATNQPSTAYRPDLDWSQVRETVLLLNLSVAHINNSMSEGDESINTLTDTVTSMIASVKLIGELAATFPDGETKNTIMKHHADVSSKIHQVVVSFQFYDKLVQRLTHASNCLTDLSELVGEPARIYNPYEWKKLQSFIESKYTVEADRVMFQALREGATISEAISLAKKQKEELSSTGDAIELF